MMTTWVFLGGSLGIALIGACIFREACHDIGKFIADRRDLAAENKFLKLSDDEMAALILAEERRERAVEAAARMQ